MGPADILSHLGKCFLFHIILSENIVIRIKENDRFHQIMNCFLFIGIKKHVQ